MQSKTPVGDIDVFAIGNSQTGVAYDSAVATNTSNTSAITGNFRAIQIINDAVFSLLTDTGSTGSLTGLTIPAGVVLFGKFTAYTLTSGAVRAYSA